MYKYYNPHPKGLATDDCVKRAIVVVTGMDYSKVQRALNEYKMVTGAKSFNSIKNLQYVEDVLKAEKITFQSNLTAGEFCRKHPTGRYILDMESHWSACVDGIIYDTWDCSKNVVNFAYEIKGEGYRLPDLKRQVFKYCCTAERISDTETCIRIYDGNGKFVERKIPTKLTKGYTRCLEDQHYSYVEIGGDR